MLIVRRLYFVTIAATSLTMLVVGAANVGGIVIEMLWGAGTIEEGLRQNLAASSAAALVGLPIWALHWWALQRFARRDPSERSSAIRRLYMYVALGVLILAAASLGSDWLQRALSVPAGGRWDPIGFFRATWYLALVLAAWAYHFWIAAADRETVGEIGASATLRRWYAYVVQSVAMVVGLFGARELLATVGGQFTARAAGATGVDAVAGAVIAFGAVWVFHRRWSSQGSIGDHDRRSTLRAVAGFSVLALSVGLSLGEISRVLYYGLARSFGVQSPGGVVGDLPRILVGPASTIVVFGASWLLMRHLLIQDTAKSETTRQAGVRRLYSHLVATLSLAALAIGVAGLLWTIADQIAGASTSPDAWRDEISLFVTLTLVGLPVWLGHWRPESERAERLALSRRLYLFASLLGGVLAGLGSLSYLVFRILNVLLGGTSLLSASEVSKAAAVAIVAALVVLYHLRVLRQDAAHRSMEIAEAATSAEDLPPLTIEVVGATEADVRRVLARLPDTAHYTLRAGGAAGQSP